MFKFFWKIYGRRAKAGEADRFRADPLSHPVLERMSERELADLPMDAPCFGLRPEGEAAQLAKRSAPAP